MSKLFYNSPSNSFFTSLVNTSFLNLYPNNFTPKSKKVELVVFNKIYDPIINSFIYLSTTGFYKTNFFQFDNLNLSFQNKFVVNLVDEDSRWNILKINYLSYHMDNISKDQINVDLANTYSTNLNTLTLNNYLKPRKIRFTNFGAYQYLPKVFYSFNDILIKIYYRRRVFIDIMGNLNTLYISSYRSYLSGTISELQLNKTQAMIGWFSFLSLNKKFNYIFILYHYVFLFYCYQFLHNFIIFLKPFFLKKRPRIPNHFWLLVHREIHFLLMFEKFYYFYLYKDK